MSREDERIAMLSDTVTNLNIAQEIEHTVEVSLALEKINYALERARERQRLNADGLSGEEVTAVRHGDVMYAAMLYQARTGLEPAEAKTKVLALIEESGLEARA